VLDEVASLELTEYFDDGIYGVLDEFKRFSKAMVIRRIITQHDLRGSEIVGFGDGYVEIGNLKDMGCRKALAELDRRGVVRLPPINESYAFEGTAARVIEVEAPEVIVNSAGSDIARSDPNSPRWMSTTLRTVV